MIVKGTVIRGKGKGKMLGFPTANIEFNSNLPSGVYGGKVNFQGKQYRAAIFYGEDRKILEAHLLDFSGDLYDRAIEVEVTDKIREVKKFENDKTMIEQIRDDIRRIAQLATDSKSGYTQIKTQKNADTRKNADFLYRDITYKIRGACFEVYKQFGGAFKEKVVENALLEELKRCGLEAEKQKRIEIFFKDKKIGAYVPDVVVNNLVLVELKCKPFITKEDERQFWYYLRGSEYKLGLLINFGPNKLDIRRRIYDTARNKSA